MSTFTSFFTGHEAFPDRQPGSYTRIVEVQGVANVLVVDKDTVTNPESKDILDYAKFNDWSMISTKRFAHLCYFLGSLTTDVLFAFVAFTLLMVVLMALGLTGTFIGFIAEWAAIIYIIFWPQEFLNPVRLMLANGILKISSYINNAIRNTF